MQPISSDQNVDLDDLSKEAKEVISEIRALRKGKEDSEAQVISDPGKQSRP